MTLDEFVSKLNNRLEDEKLTGFTWNNDDFAQGYNEALEDIERHIMNLCEAEGAN